MAEATPTARPQAYTVPQRRGSGNADSWKQEHGRGQGRKTYDNRQQLPWRQNNKRTNVKDAPAGHKNTQQNNYRYRGQPYSQRNLLPQQLRTDTKYGNEKTNNQVPLKPSAGLHSTPKKVVRFENQNEPVNVSDLSEVSNHQEITTTTEADMHAVLPQLQVSLHRPVESPDVQIIDEADLSETSSECKTPVTNGSGDPDQQQEMPQGNQNENKKDSPPEQNEPITNTCVEEHKDNQSFLAKGRASERRDIESQQTPDQQSE